MERKQAIKKAVKTALVVGTILNVINQGPSFWAGEALKPIQFFLTYCVPFCVYLWGVYSMKKHHRNNSSKQ